MFATGFLPYGASANLNNGKLALAMLNRGWELDVVSAVDEGVMYGAVWDKPWLPLQTITHEIHYTHGGCVVRVVQRLSQSAQLGHPIPGIRWAYAALHEGLRLHQKRPYDFVLSRFLGESSHLPALAFVARTGVPWLANWNDPTTDSFPAPYNCRQPPLKRMMSSRYYRKVATAADFNTFPCQRLADHMMPALGLRDKNKLRVIPHIGLEGYEPTARPDPAVFTLCHAGNLSAERDSRVLLWAIRKLIDEEKPTRPLRLEIIGVENSALRQGTDDFRLRDVVTCTGGISYLETLERLAASSVTVIIEAPCGEGIFLPGKLADYATVRRPILSLSPRIGTVKDMITQHGGGIVSDCASREETYSALHALYAAWRARSLENYVSPSLGAALSGAVAIAGYEQLFAELNTERSY